MKNKLKPWTPKRRRFSSLMFCRGCCVPVLMKILNCCSLCVPTLVGSYPQVSKNSGGVGGEDVPHAQQDTQTVSIAIILCQH